MIGRFWSTLLAWYLAFCNCSEAFLRLVVYDEVVRSWKEMVKGKG